uniref:Uncharacterized protein n=1 Tax=Cucumis sativus TaxID=3659 RepID=A0A0A0KSW8_CUCSA
MVQKMAVGDLKKSEHHACDFLPFGLPLISDFWVLIRQCKSLGHSHRRDEDFGGMRKDLDLKSLHQVDNDQQRGFLRSLALKQTK